MMSGSVTPCHCAHILALKINCVYQGDKSMSPVDLRDSILQTTKCDTDLLPAEIRGGENLDSEFALHDS